MEVERYISQNRIPAKSWTVKHLATGGTILYMGSANERRRYYVIPFLIAQAPPKTIAEQEHR